ncbi:MAG: NUDIX hydrolase [Candidatus Aenigmatarchaeota archaeon]
MKTILNLPYKTFLKLHKIVPFVVAEIIIKDKRRILLAKRKISPFKGRWHIPGGQIGYNEKIIDAVKRIAERETGVNVKIIKYMGYYDSIRMDPRGHYIPHVFLVKLVGGKIQTNKENSDLKFFKTAPKNLLSYHKPLFRAAMKGRNIN